MKQEDYVSFEVAKLLKEKGYNKPSKYYYCKYSGEFSNSYLEIRNNKESLIPSACTTHPLTEVAKWLREKHNLVITISPTYYDYYGNIVGFGYVYSVFNIKNEEVFQKDLQKTLDIPYEMFDTYEEALNEGIKEALNYIIL